MTIKSVTECKKKAADDCFYQFQLVTIVTATILLVCLSWWLYFKLKSGQTGNR